MINAGKEQADVALEDVAEPPAVLRAAIESPVGPFSDPVRIRIEDERPLNSGSITRQSA